MRLLPMLLACACAGRAPAAARAVQPSTTPEPAPPALRLPGDVRPLRVALDLAIAPDQPTFTGSVRIDVEVLRPTRIIWLNATDLTIDPGSARVGSARARLVPGGKDFVGLLLPTELAPGRTVLELHYRGAIDRERSRGIYAVAEGKDWYVYTMFQPIDARRAFPCFDEPIYKTPWQITLHIPRGQVARANAPIATQADDAVVFAESKPIPSEVIAFVVGPFDVVDGGTAGRAATPIHYIVPRGRAAELAWARASTPRVVAALEDYFDMPYPYEKLDVAVVPRFWGTLEHPGIVAMGQPLSLIPPGAETIARKRRYTNILAHELAHFWFGDYVTPKWWSDTWLNEAFASWLDRIITSSLHPEWGYRDRALRSTIDAMGGDELSAARAMSQPVDTAEGIEASFDNDISYDKGAAVLEMFESFAGKEAFQRAIRDYIRAHAWGHADAQDFLAALRADLGEPVAHGFEGFATRPGLPLVRHTLSCKPDGNALLLTQERAHKSGGAPDRSTLWQFPVCARYGTSKTAHEGCVLLTEKAASIPLDDCPTWVTTNAGGRGYYRSAYDAGELDALFATSAGEAPPLTRAERQMLLGDTVDGIERGDLDATLALKLATRLARDPDDALAERAAASLVTLAEPLHLDEATHAHYQRFLLSTFGPRAQKLGWKRRPTDDEMRHELRVEILPLAARAGDARLAGEADQLARVWLQDPDRVDHDLAFGVLRVAARRGDAAFFEAVLAAGKTLPRRPDRHEALAALGAFVDPALASRARELILGNDLDVRDASWLIREQLHARETRVEAWRWLADHLDALTTRLRDDEAGWLLREAMNAFCDPRDRDAALATLKPVAARLAGAQNQLDKAAENVDQCIRVRARDTQAVRTFLSRY